MFAASVFGSDRSTNQFNSVTGKVNAVQTSGRAHTVRQLVEDYSTSISVAESLETLLDYYSNRQFDLVAQNLSVFDYENYANTINNINASNRLRTVLKSFFFSTLQGIQQSVFQYTEFTSMSSRLEELKHCDEILNDPDKLREHLEKIRKSRGFGSFLTIPEVNIESAVLRLEYIEYCILYGLPSSGIFEADKLNEIRERMGLTS
jgi:hypothetical protein